MRALYAVVRAAWVTVWFVLRGLYLLAWWVLHTATCCGDYDQPDTWTRHYEDDGDPTIYF